MAATSPSCFDTKEKDREWIEALVYERERTRLRSEPSQSQQSPAKTSYSKDSCPVCKLSPNTPWSEEEKNEHVQHCLEEFQAQKGTVRRSMERSKEMECGICLENILDAQNPSRLQCQKSFGILDQCNHKFCLPCIRRWRSDSNIESYRCCPCCRIPSDFVAPAVHWVEENDKEELINRHKEELSEFKTMVKALRSTCGAQQEPYHDTIFDSFFSYMSPDLNELANLNMKQGLCVEEEMNEVEVDHNQLVTFIEIITTITISNFKEIFEEHEED